MTLSYLRAETSVIILLGAFIEQIGCEFVKTHSAKRVPVIHQGSDQHNAQYFGYWVFAESAGFSESLELDIEIRSNCTKESLHTGIRSMPGMTWNRCITYCKCTGDNVWDQFKQMVLLVVMYLEQHNFARTEWVRDLQQQRVHVFCKYSLQTEIMALNFTFSTIAATIAQQ